MFLRRSFLCALLAMVCLGLARPGTAAPAGRAPQADDPSAPGETVKLIFIHHSTGQNWLADGDGGLGLALRDNNYFVSDTNYGWGPDGIGDATDIGHWWRWFNSGERDTYLQGLLQEFEQHSSYTRRADPDKARPNQIVLFKSCFPNSNLDGEPGDAATTGDNPLRDQAAGSEFHTVANAKGIYNDLLPYFSTHLDTLFVVVTAPPLRSGDTNSTRAANARAFNDWLVNDWLDPYTHTNVAVYDFYTVLTSHGGSASQNDLNAVSGNHHRWFNGAIQHVKGLDNNFLLYPTGDSHPSRAGNLKATGEFVPVLNVFYHRWANTPITPQDKKIYLPLVTLVR